MKTIESTLIFQTVGFVVYFCTFYFCIIFTVSICNSCPLHHKYILYSEHSIVLSDLCKLSHLLHLFHSPNIFTFLHGAIACSVTNGSQSGSAILENSSVTAWMFLSHGMKNSIALAQLLPLWIRRQKMCLIYFLCQAPNCYVPT